MTISYNDTTQKFWKTVRDNAALLSDKPVATKIETAPPKQLSNSTCGVYMPPLEYDPRGCSPSDPGAKLDAGKSRVWLMLKDFSHALEEVAKVTTIGANKYSPGGWLSVPNGEARYMDAFGRHMVSLGKGETYDSAPGGTNCKHKAQMIWNLLASLELEYK